MKFIDEVTLYVKAGDGGAGCVSFYRGKGIPKGGPDGGDGANGGSVFFRADESVSTLLDLKFTRRILAPHGQPGTGKECNGRAGEPMYVRVPVGTLVWDAITGEAVADLSEAGQEVKIAQGGRGGLGNMNFATSVRRAPMFAQPGTEGEERNLRLELRLLADVGLVGFPNVGKSTLISRVSAARPKIADYPFTTLVPNLGVVRVDEGRSFVVADIPGLIPGASAGRGLGFQFLRHISRVRVIVHLLAFDLSEKRSPVSDYRAIRKELAAFDPELAAKPEVIVLNKCELTESKALLAKVKRMAKGQKVFAISAVTGEGVAELVQHLSRLLSKPSVTSEIDSRAADSPLSGGDALEPGALRAPPTRAVTARPRRKARTQPVA